MPQNQSLSPCELADVENVFSQRKNIITISNSTAVMLSLANTFLFYVEFLSFSHAAAFQRPDIPFGDPLFNLNQRLQDAQQVDTWTIRTHPSLEINEKQVDHVPMVKFEGMYGKYLFQWLNPDQQSNIEKIVHSLSLKCGSNAVDSDGSFWRDSTRSSTTIWKLRRDRDQNYRHNKYLIFFRDRNLQFGNIWAICDEDVILWMEHKHPFQAPEPSKNFPLLINEDYDSFCKFHANHKQTVSENERLESEILKLETSNQELVIGGAATLGFLVLIMIIGLFCWLKRRRSSGGSMNTTNTSLAPQQIQRIIRDYRPRSRTIEELHYKFGMNEIDKVTAKEGCDLVRIARPLETAGAGRKLSEELFGIEPIISDDSHCTEGRQQTRDIPLKTGTAGEGGDTP